MRSVCGRSTRSLGIIREMAISPLLVTSFIDSCAFDPKYEPETSAANQLHKLSDEGTLQRQIACSTQKEREHPNTPAWVKKQGQSLVDTIEVGMTPYERELLRDVHAILTGNGRSETFAQDARHVFEAQKYGGYFVTTDKRIIDKAQELQHRCGVEILLPSQFLKLVEQFLSEENDA